MAIYHCHCKVISRGQGRSAVGAAAYRSGERITNDYDGITHDYTRKSGVVYSEIMLCENAPQEYKSRSILWNEVERQEKGGKARLAREYEIALPVELSREEQIQLVRDYCRDSFVSKGMIADFAIHDKGDGNPHAHIMLTTRPIEKDGSWGTKQKKEYILDKDGNKQYDPKKKTYKCRTVKVNDWDTTEFLERSRAEWAASLNRALEKKNLPQRVDHRSFSAQGKEQTPTRHLGVAALHIEKRGGVSDRGTVNREIKKANAQIKKIDYIKYRTQKEIAFIREDMKWNQLHSLVYQLESKCGEYGENEKALQKMQESLLMLYEQAKIIKPTTATEGRMVLYHRAEVPYYDYHKNKLQEDISDLLRRVKESLATFKELRQETAGTLEQTPIERVREKLEAVKEKTPAAASREPEQGQTVAPAYDVGAVARQLAEYRAAFVRASVQAQGRTSYQENPIPRQQAVQIADLARRVQEQTTSIKQLQAEKESLGMFKGKEKKALQEKIDNFSRLRRENISKLEALGVSDPVKADEAVKEKNLLAAAEQEKTKAARQNVGAADRAEEAKAAFIALARSVPDSFRQEVAEQIEQTTAAEPESVGERLTQFKAEAEARRQLDSVLKQEQERQQGQSRTRWDER